MTELAIRNDWGVVDTMPAPAPAALSLMDWVAQAKEVAIIAEMLCRTSFVPKAFQNKAPECAAAILAGQEMGMAPMASLRAIDVIEGKPGLTALGLRAQVQSKGHKIWTVETTATRAIVKGQRLGSDTVETSTWDIDRAKTFGLTAKKNWREQPTSMLLARATAECARLVAADAILGMPYSSEELADGVDGVEVAGDTDPDVPTQPKGRARRKTPVQAPPVAEPTIEQPNADVPLVSDDADDATPVSAILVSPAPAGDARADDALVKRMQTVLTEAGHASSDERRAYIVGVIGRDLGSMKELTVGEAEKVIDDVLAPPLKVSEFDDEAWMTGTDGPR